MKRTDNFFRQPEGHEREVRHFSFDISTSGMTYSPGTVHGKHSSGISCTRSSPCQFSAHSSFFCFLFFVFSYCFVFCFPFIYFFPSDFLSSVFPFFGFDVITVFKSVLFSFGWLAGWLFCLFKRCVSLPNLYMCIFFYFIWCVIDGPIASVQLDDSVNIDVELSQAKRAAKIYICMFLFFPFSWQVMWCALCRRI